MVPKCRVRMMYKADNDMKEVDGTCSVCVEIERLVAGSLANEQGDTILAFTEGASGVAEELCTIMEQGNSARHASLCAWIHPGTMKVTILHVQGRHTVFSQVRAYDTRVVYECTPSDLRRMGGYVSMITALDGMRHYDERQYGMSPLVNVNRVPDSPLTEDEQTLLGALIEAINNDSRVMVALGDDECRQANDLLASPRLLSILRVFSHLSDDMLPLASLAFAVEHSCPGIQVLWPYMRLVAHFDEVEQWGEEAEKACMLDWRGPHLRKTSAMGEKDAKRS